MEAKTCETCGKLFKGRLGKPNRFCSPACHDEGRRKHRQCEICDRDCKRGKRFCSHECAAIGHRVSRKQEIVNCVVCGKDFKRALSRRAKMCSLKCRAKYLTEINVSRRKRVIKYCEKCGASFEVRASNIRARFCSYECRRNQHEYCCLTCGKRWTGVASLKADYCSRTCAGKAIAKGRESSGFYPDRVTVICAFCSLLFNVPQNRKHEARFCSRSCAGKATIEKRKASGFYPDRIEIACATCGKEFDVPQHKKNRAKYCSRSCKSISVVRKMATNSPTSIEIETYQALDELGVIYKPQHPVGRFVIDALIEDKDIVVECQGDYWHCNPSRYPNGPINNRQREAIEKDKRRFEWLKSKGYQVIELWESDIKTYGARFLLERALAV